MHDAWWDQARMHGERGGTRALIEVFLLDRHLSREHVVADLASALPTGAMTADGVALEACKAEQAETEPTPVAHYPSDIAAARPSGGDPHHARHGAGLSRWRVIACLRGTRAIAAVVAAGTAAVGNERIVKTGTRTGTGHRQCRGPIRLR